MSWADRQRAATHLQIGPVGSGQRRTARDERLIDLYEWVRAQRPRDSVPAGRLLGVVVHELAACPTGRYVTIVDGRVETSTEQDILDRLHEGRTVTVILPPRERASC